MYREYAVDLVFAEVPISVDVIEFEGPLQFLRHRSLRCDAQRCHKLPEVNDSVSVSVVVSEDVVAEVGGVSLGVPHFPVEGRELRLADLAVGKVALKVLEPFVQLLRREFRLFRELLEVRFVLFVAHSRLLVSVLLWPQRL